jgi:arsenate reductase-like glutaredoxin family protein
VSCGRTQEYLASNQISAASEANAKKSTLNRAAALALAKEADEVYAAKGKNIVHFNLKKDQPSEAELAAVLLGPTGNLRAPTIRRGRTLIVGFDRAMYDKLL